MIKEGAENYKLPKEAASNPQILFQPNIHIESHNVNKNELHLEIDTQTTGELARLYDLLDQKEKPSKQIELMQSQIDEILKSKKKSQLKDYLPTWQNILKCFLCWF